MKRGPYKKRLCMRCGKKTSVAKLARTGRCHNCSGPLHPSNHLSSVEAAVILDCSPDDMYFLANYGMVRGGRYLNSRRRWYDKASVMLYKKFKDRHEWRIERDD